MVSEIILHVGLHKTGTTSIQQTLFLDENNGLLKEHGFLYPKKWVANHSIPIYSAFCDYPERYHINIRNNFTTDEIKTINQKNLKILKEEIKERRLPKLVISGEDISMLTYQNLSNLKTYLLSISNNIKVIIYVRNPISWAISNIQELIKGGHSYKNSFLNISKTSENLFQSRIEKFSKIFGKESINVLTYEHASIYEFGLVGHFLSAVGLTDNEINKLKLIRSNDSISLVAGDIISYINERLPLIKDGKINEKRSQNDINPLLTIRGPKFDIPNADKKTLIENARQNVNWLKENFDIDYVFTGTIPEYETKQIMNPDIVEDIKKVYYQSPEHLKPLILDYLCHKLKNTEQRFFI